MKTNHRKKELSKNIAVIVLLHGNNEEGQPVYCYIGIRGDKYESFMAVQKSGQIFNPEDYGVVIISGDNEPSEEVKKYMTEEYGFNHEAINQ